MTVVVSISYPGSQVGAAKEVVDVLRESGYTVRCDGFERVPWDCETSRPHADRVGYELASKAGEAIIIVDRTYSARQYQKSEAQQLISAIESQGRRALILIEAGCSLPECFQGHNVEEWTVSPVEAVRRSLLLTSGDRDIDQTENEQPPEHGIYKLPPTTHHVDLLSTHETATGNLHLSPEEAELLHRVEIGAELKFNTTGTYGSYGLPPGVDELDDHARASIEALEKRGLIEVEKSNYWHGGFPHSISIKRK